MRRTVGTLMALALAALLYGYVALPEPPAEAPALTEATVTSVWDGDTITVEISGERQKVRLIGIDTPEIGEHEEPLGAEAKSRTEALVEGKTAWVSRDVSDTDRYGRHLYFVWLQKPASLTLEEARTKMLNALLLQEGLASTMTVEPDTRWSEAFEALEDEARKDRLGLWKE